MSDLIKREDVMQVAFLYPFFSDALMEEIKAIPSADRPQGEWLKDDEGTFICSACGSGYKDQPTLMGKPMFKWCPLCGARMKGADDE